MALFGTAGIRGPVTSAVTPELALAVGRAAGVEARDQNRPTFVVGRDGRLTGPTLQRAMIAGLQAAGAAVVLVGQVPTPTLAFASQGRRGVMLTASHNPPTDNGIKLFRDGVEYDSAAETRVQDLVDAPGELAPWSQWTEPSREPVLEPYRVAAAEYAMARGSPLNGLRIAVDCGSGMASRATPQVLRRLGAEVVALSANVDGTFPARDSKPTPETLTDLRAFVADGDWQLGFGADGDADRLVVVAGDGTVVHEDTVLAVLAEAYTKASDAADPVVVTTPNASARIDERVEASDGRVERVALGYLHEGIANVARTGGTVVFAGEPWKHIHPAFGGWIDGVTSAAVVARLVAAAGGLAQLRAPVTERPYRKVSVDCPDERKAPTMTELRSRLPQAFPDATVETQHGVRLDRPDGSWVLVRSSGTEPYVRVYAEGEDVESLIARATGLVEDAIETAR